MTISPSRARRLVRRLPVVDDVVRDPRRAQGRVHPLGGLLRTLVIGFACQKPTLRAIESLSRDMSPKLRRQIGLRRAVSDTTLYEVLLRLHPEGLREILQRQIRVDLDSKAIQNDLLPFGMLAVDGKGAGSGLGSAPSADCKEGVLNEFGGQYWHLFCLRAALVSSSARPVLDQEAIGNKTGEPTHLAPMLRRLVATYPKLFRLVSGDANFTSRAAALLIHEELGRDFLFCVKANRQAIFDQATLQLSEAPVVEETKEQARGQLVTRTLRRAPAPAAFDGLPGTTEFWMVTQIRENPSGPPHREERIYATSLPAGALSDSQRLKAVRAHWGIENGPNWTADVVLEEDQRSPCRNGEGMLVVSWLRLLAYNLLSVFRHRLPRSEPDRSWRRAVELIYQALIVLSCHLDAIAKIA